MTTPTHCRERRGLPKNKTDARIVKNFLVVVMMDVVRGPKVVTVRKMKFCRRRKTTVAPASRWMDRKGNAIQISHYIL